MKKIRVNSIKEFRMHEWIMIEDGRSFFYGYITDINNSSERFDMYVVKRVSKEEDLEENVGNHNFNRLNLYSHYKVYRLPEVPLDNEDKKALIDLALSTKDEAWFKELIG